MEKPTRDTPFFLLLWSPSDSGANERFDNVQYFSHIWKEEGCSPPSLKEGILPMASDHKQKEDYMSKDISKPEERITYNIFRTFGKRRGVVPQA